MEQSISRPVAKLGTFPQRERRRLPRRELDDPETPDDVVPPELSDREKNRQRVWRAVSWTLLVNVFVFWLMTCITAFARITAT